MAHSFSRFIYFDTNILSHLAKTRSMWSRLSEYLVRHDLTIAVGSQVAELADVASLHEALANMLLVAPSALIKPWNEVLLEEVNAHPNMRKETLCLYPLNGLILEQPGPQKLLDFFSSGPLKEARHGQLESARQLASRHSELKPNFPPGKSGYTKTQALEFAWIQVLQWLAHDHLHFLKQFQEDATKLNAHVFQSVRLSALVLFYKYYLGNRNPTKLSDFGDSFHLYAIPYCEIAVMERDLTNVLGQIKRNDAVLEFTDIYNIDFLIDWPPPSRDNLVHDGERP
jgi:hypothetical protein